MLERSLNKMTGQKKILYGLVLVGGKSKRLKKDKASLVFHQKEQYWHCYDLLMPFCEKVFLSLADVSGDNKFTKDLPRIYDQNPYFDIGPMGGILSAMESYPNASWLVLACDLPCVRSQTIANLIEHRDESKLITAYGSAVDQLPEPVCAIYEKESVFALKKKVQIKKYCLRKFMIESEANIIALLNPNDLLNVNTPEDYQAVVNQLEV